MTVLPAMLCAPYDLPKQPVGRRSTLGTSQQMTRANNEIWNNVALFENYDYVQNWYLRRHARQLSATWTSQINSAFRQAREYFDSASIAGATVRPLLLYYGCAALAQGTTLALTGKLIPGFLPASHGLGTSNWSEHLSEQNVHGVLDLTIVSQPGLFREFCKAAGNSETFVLHHSQHTLIPIKADYRIPKFVTSNETALSLGDLLRRDHRTANLYEKVTGADAKVHQTTIRVQGKDGGRDEPFKPTGLTFKLTGAHPNVGIGMVQKMFGNDVRVSSIGGPKYKYVPLVHLDWEVRLTDPSVVPMLVGELDDLYLSEDFEGGDRLTLVHRTYMVAYMLGMLARYHPATWMALLQNVKGAAAQPIIQTSLDSIEQDFPSQILRILS